MRLVCTYTDLRRLYGFCALIGLCVHIQLYIRVVWLLRVKRLVHTDTGSWFFQHFGDIILRICWFVQRTDDLILKFVDSFDVRATNCDGLPGGSVRRMWYSGFFRRQSVHYDWTVLRILLLGSVEIFIWRCSCDSLSDSYLGLTLVEKYYNPV